MQSRQPRPSLARAAVAGFLVVQLLWVLVLAAAPALHEWLHGEAEHAEHGEHGQEAPEKQHDCAVTLFLSGACDCAPAPLLATAPRLLLSANAFAPESESVRFSFRSRGVLEHAPPLSA